ncbi:MAG TPA: 3-isopropylmalate dehydratase small subunit [Steroidobacteraceae bacterium]|jgi:3-isopropylmalate/(R)-2-methylmalate dehydratase small subunit|nr:3-isopropylmalate dehydratase small subunit [Steroidobacteraceae bacterium]
MKAIEVLRSRTVVLPGSNIDTDQIIPARFLTTTTREGLGRSLFADWRYDGQGALRPDFVLNRPEAQGCRVLVAGRNFGCGSSREHAPWALLDYGIQAVISTEIADIFRSNSLKNGFLPVVVDETTSSWLIANPGAEVTIDVASTTLTLPTGVSVKFPLEAFSRYCLLNGVDELGFLLDRRGDIEAYEQRRHS